MLDKGENKVMVLGVIGAGNMAQAIIAGIKKSHSLDCKNIIVSNYNKQKAARLSEECGVLTDDNINVIKKSDIVLLAVKPYALINTLELYQNELLDKIVISVAAGISISDMEKVNTRLKIIRVMPNTPVQICQGVFAYVYGANIIKEDKEIFNSIFSKLGMFIEIDESKIDAVSSLTGCSPAYIYQIIEAMSDAGVKMGLPRELAISLSAMAVHGSGGMVHFTGTHPAVLKDKVTSPAGSTIEGLAELESKGVRGAVISALYKAYEKTLLFSKK